MEKIKDQELDNLQTLTAEFNKLKTHFAKAWCLLKGRGTKKRISYS